MVILAKKVEKNDHNFPNFFFRKIEHKTSSETKFHQKRTKTRDFSSITARHEKITSSESGLNSRDFTTVESTFRGSGQNRSSLFVMKMMNNQTILLKLRS